MEEKKLKELEQRSFENAAYVSKTPTEEAALTIQKIYAVYKNQGFDFAIINDSGVMKFNQDRMKFLELIANADISEVGNKFEKRLSVQEYEFLKAYIEYGKYHLQHQMPERQKTKVMDVSPKETAAYQRLCQNVIGQEEMKHTLCKLGAVYQFARKREEYHLPTPPIHKVLAFIGPPGTAKTTSARYFAEMMTEQELLSGGSIAYVTGTQLKAKYVGQTSDRVHQIFETNDIIIIDEAYSLVNYNETERTDNFSQEALAQLCIEVEEHSDDKLIIFAGYGGDIHEKNNKMKRFLDENPGISSRITFTVHFSPYSAKEMLDIFEALANNATFHLEKGWEDILLPFFEKRVKDENFGNGREARRLLEHTMAVAAERFMQWQQNAMFCSQIAKEKEERKQLSLLTCEDLNTAIQEFIRG